MAKLRIKEVAARHGVKHQNTLVARSGVTAQLINRYWHNHIQRVDLDELEKIAKALGVRTADLIVDNDEVVESVA